MSDNWVVQHLINTLDTVREMVGHADERTTLQSYHFDRSTEDERVLKMEEALKLEDD